jgi:electron transport complex protein RnfG
VADAGSTSKQLPSTFLNMLLVMLILSVLSAGALGLTYTGTADQIAANALEKQKQALSLVLPSFTNDPVSEQLISPVNPRVILYPARANGRLVGLGVQTFSDQGYGGTLTLMVGFDGQGNILLSQTLSHSETPGLGSKVTLESFSQQFVGISSGAGTLSLSRDGGDFDAVTAATISSRAYLGALNTALEAAAQFFREAR